MRISKVLIEYLVRKQIVEVLYGYRTTGFLFRGKRYSSYIIDVRNVKILVDIISVECVNITIIEYRVSKDEDAGYYFESVERSNKNFDKIYKLVNIYVNNGFGNYKKPTLIGDYIDTK